MEKHTKIIVATITLLIMLPLMIIPASANSALTEWGGKDANGIVAADEDCPIVVEHETLTFNINDLPDANPYEGDNSSLESYVTAEYTFYNPSDAEITATLAFPFGVVKSTDYDATDERYSITVNGEKIETELRHTYYYSRSGEFDVNENIPRLVDDYVRDDYFNDELKIKKYTVILSTTGDEIAYNWKFDINPDEYPNTVFYVPSKDYTSKQENGSLRVTGIMNSKRREIDVYVFGEAKGVPEFKFYTHSWTFNGEVHGGDEVEGTSSIINSKVINFSDFIFENYDEGSNVSRMDWYNATIHKLQTENLSNKFLYFARFDENYQNSLMSWYCYDITIGAGERITNSVTAPMIPRTSIRTSPPTYTYNYLISPAATWADFGSLDIIINTPYYLTYSNIDGFEKTDNGYELHLDGLPMTKDRYKLTLNGIEKVEGGVKDLAFKISTAEKPQSKNKLTPIQTVLLVIAIIIFLPILIVVGIIYGAVILIKKIAKH